MKLPVVSGKKLVNILLKKGYYLKNQKGSHIHLWHNEKRPITIPNHKTISKGTLKVILDVTGLKLNDLK